MHRSALFSAFALAAIAVSGSAFAQVPPYIPSGNAPGYVGAPAPLIGLGLPVAAGVLIALGLVRRFRRHD